MILDHPCRLLPHAHSTPPPQDGGHLLSELSSSPELSQSDRHSPSSSIDGRSSPSTGHCSLSSLGDMLSPDGHPSLGGTPSPLSQDDDRCPLLSSHGDTPSPLSLEGERHPSLSSLGGTPSPLSLGGDGHASLSSLGDTPSPLSSLDDDHRSFSSLGDTLSPSSLDDALPSFEQAFENKELFEPLYDGADITICGAYCCIMQFASANKLSYTAISELINLLHVLCPVPNKLLYATEVL